MEGLAGLEVKIFQLWYSTKPTPPEMKECGRCARLVNLNSFIGWKSNFSSGTEHPLFSSCIKNFNLKSKPMLYSTLLK